MERTTNDSTIKKSTKGSSTIRTSEMSANKEIKELNKRVWRSWWKSYLERCDLFIQAVKKGDIEKVAKLINVDYAKD